MKNKFKKLLFLGVLSLFSLFITGIYLYSNSNPTVISESFNKSALTKATFSELLKGEKIQGKFKSNQNYLGQVSVRFYNFDRINSDSVIFRIRQEDKGSWYYENIYKTDQFQPNQLFPFGFPIVSDSKNKTYFFEIESAGGKSEDAVTLSSVEPMVMSSYQYPKKLIIKDKNVLVEFFVNKLTSVKLNLDFSFLAITYLNTLLIFLSLLYLSFDYFSNKKLILIKINALRVIIVGVIILIASFTFYYLKRYDLSDSISIVGYLILLIGALIAVFEAKKYKK